MSDETRLCQLEERMKLLEEKMEYLWMFYLRFIKSIAEALPNQSSASTSIYTEEEE